MNKHLTIDETIDFIFLTYDADQKGKLSQPESERFFKELFLYFKQNPDPITLKNLFHSIDFDNDGFMTKAELKRVIDTRHYY